MRYGETMGGGTDTFVDESLSRRVDMLVQEDGELSGTNIYHVYLCHRGAMQSIGVGS